MLIFENSLYIYKSLSNTWTCKAFLQLVPWKIHKDSREFLYQTPYAFIVIPSTIVGGNIFFGELDVDRNVMPIEQEAYDVNIRNLGYVRVFEINKEAST